MAASLSQPDIMLFKAFSRCEEYCLELASIECGQEPLQFYWFRATVEIFNNLLISNSQTLRQVLKADLHLADMDES
eukprot:102600-Pelagomonas_calceolata.AAC.1